MAQRNMIDTGFPADSNFGFMQRFECEFLPSSGCRLSWTAA
jgi:hypothetical protein